MRNALILTFFCLIAMNASAKIWQVGPTRTYKVPSAVAALVADGDTIEIDAGLYTKDVAVWSKNNLVFRCKAGYAHLDAQGTAAARKGIWVLDGDNQYVEGIEFSGCAISAADGDNGAGIRFESHKLECRRCYFHDNQEGILTGNDTTNEINIEACEFDHNGVETGGAAGFEHNIYIGHSRSLRIAFCYFHRSIVGHEIKSRANHNFIYYNLIADSADGDGSYSINLPNGGESFVIGNAIEKGPKTANSTVIDYGSEGLINGDSLLYFGNNTVVSDRTPSTFFHLADGAQVFIANNIFVGGTTFATGHLDTIDNIISKDRSMFHFASPSQFDYRPTATFPGFTRGEEEVLRQRMLNPTFEYVHPMDSTPRVWTNEVGAFNLHSELTVRERASMPISNNSPNPFSNVTHILLPQVAVGNVIVAIYNEAGMMLSSAEYPVRNSEIEFARASLASGSYFYIVADAGGRQISSGTMQVR